MPRLKIKKACSDCPYRRKAWAGWLGADTAENFVKGAVADYADWPLPCHLMIDYEDPDWLKTQYPDAALCAGALIFCRNTGKMPRDPQRAAWVSSVRTDREAVFAKEEEFLEHHRQSYKRDRQAEERLQEAI